MRGLVDGDPLARERLRMRVAWPTHVYVEVAQALLRLYRHGDVSPSRARAALRALYAVDADAHPVEALTRAAWRLASERQLTVYDACYVILAEGLDVPLMTADRQQAAAARDAVLLA